jgi:hypothetical protein
MTIMNLGELRAELARYAELPNNIPVLVATHHHGILPIDRIALDITSKPFLDLLRKAFADPAGWHSD